MASEQLRIISTRVIDPFNFWGQIGTDESLAQFEAFEKSLNEYCTSAEGRCTQCDDLAPKQLVLVHCSILDRWCRAVVMSVDGEREEVDVLYVDYSITEFVTLSLIVDALPSDAETFPPQALKMTLAGVKPIAQTWISRAVIFFSNLVLGKKHDVQVISKNETSVVVDILVGEGETRDLVSNLLIKEGFALPASVDGDKGASKKGSSVPTFNLKSLASLKTNEDSGAAGDTGDEPNIEQELFAKGIDCTNVSTYKGCSDFDFIGGVPRSPCDAIGDIRSQIQFMTENPAKIPQAEEKRSPQPPRRSKHSDEKSPLKPRTGRPPRFAERVVERDGGVSSPTSRKILPNQEGENEQNIGRDVEEGENITFVRKFCSKSTASDDCHASSTAPRKTKRPLSPGTPGGGSSRSSPAPRHHETPRSSPDPSARVDRQRGSLNLDSPNPLRRRASPEGRGNTSPVMPRRQGGRVGEGRERSRDGRERSGKAHPRGNHKEKTAASSTREELQNEHDWQTDQLTHKFTKVLDDVTEDTYETASRDLHKLLVQVSSQFEDLPGEGALYCCLDAIVRTATSDKMPCDLVVRLVQSLSGLDEFPEVLRRVLLKYHMTVIKVATAPRMRLQCHNFVMFLATLFNRVSSWEDCDAVTDCIIHSLHKWAVFNTKATSVDRRGVSELFSECLFDFISVGGSTLEHHFPVDCDTLFGYITEKILSNDVARPIKEKMLQLVINRQRATDATQHVRTNGVATETVAVAMEMVAVATETVAVATTTNETQTEPPARVLTSDSAIQIDLLPITGLSGDQSAPRRAVSCASDESSINDLDPYAQVKRMLSELHLEEITEVFVSNAVRDTLLDFEPADLKDLLKECGLRPGELLEIKMYLANRDKRSMSDDSSTRSIRTNSNSQEIRHSTNSLHTTNNTNSSVAAKTPSTTVLFAPADFVRPSSVTDFNTYQSAAAQTVQSIHKPLPHIPDARDVNPITTTTSAHKHCSVPPGFQCSNLAFESTSRLAQRRAADMAIRDSDTSDSFCDSDDESCDDIPRSQPHTPADIPKVSTHDHISKPSCHTDTAVSSAIRNIPVDMTQSDSEVPDSWFDRDDASTPDLPKASGCSKSRRESLVNIKNIVSDWLKPNESLPVPARTEITQPIKLVDMSAPRRHSSSGSWADIVANQTPGTSPGDAIDWPSITEALAMPSDKTVPLVAHVSGENHGKKMSPFPVEPAEVVRLPFGVNQKRVCTLCGSADHIIYDCPRGSHSILFD